jgi:23S rRNA (adenine2030-N6)-methyltransferase
MSKHDQPFDYSHQFKAGNLGDVLKHAVLGEVLRTLTAGPPLTVLDTHAGAGHYKLGPTGEWQAGVGRLDDSLPAHAPEGLVQYLAGAGRRLLNKGGHYPGSPRRILNALRPEDQLVVVEMMDEVRAQLTAHLAPDARVQVRGGDGLAALTELQSAPGRLFVFIDPPFTRRAEWAEVADAVVALHAARPDAHCLLWYPIKSLTRPNRLQRVLREGGVPNLALDLISTPLEHHRKALNGSGVVLTQPTGALATALVALAPTLGDLLATHGDWELRTRRWGLAPRHPQAVPAPD